MKQVGMLFVVVLLSAGLIACSGLREVTYPADFRYIDQAEVKSTMSTLGRLIWEVEELLSEADQSVEQRDKVILLLTEIESYASMLDPKGKPTNHLLIDAHMQDFIDAVELARLSLQLEPPRYYRAGQLSGRCMGCHIHR